MGCGEFLVKYILFFANLAFALAGLVLLGIGIAVQLQISQIVAITDANFQAAPISSMVVGSVVFLIAFIGCCGAIKESNCMLVTYSILLIFLMIAKITLASLIFVKLDDIVNQIPVWLNNSFNTNLNSFFEIQSTFKCCGTTGATSYPLTTVILPESCCATTPCTLVNSYTGCNTVVQDFFNTFGYTIGIVCIVVVAIELVAVVFGLCLANHVRNKYRRARY